MFIMWGHKRTLRKLGFVADFCPICREIRAFKLNRIGSASHIYYISFGAGKLVCHTIECCDCGQALKTDPMLYASYQKTPPTDVESLVQETYPNLRKANADRLAAEARIKRSPRSLPAEERAQFIVEPFSLLNPIVEERFTGDTRTDKQSNIGCLGTLIISAILLGIAVNLRPGKQEPVMIVAGILCCIGTVYTLVQMGLGPRRFLRAKVLPMLARALEPLEPTQDELTACLNRCKTAGMKIGEKLKLAPLWEALQKRTAEISESRLR